MRFNYIITIHNKEDLLQNVVESVVNCMGPNSCMYPVLDGCTDNSEAIIDACIKQHPDKKIVKLYAGDVHELKSINVGLRAAEQSDDVINVILQDDVVLEDRNMEAHISALYAQTDKLGIVSLRHGGNLSRESILKSTQVLPIIDYKESVYGHNPNLFTCFAPGTFAYREIPIKSPICIPGYVVQNVGIPDEQYAPWDDIAYCYKVSNYGYNNGIFAIKYASEIAWGTTRLKEQKTSIPAVQIRNLEVFRSNNIKTLENDRLREIYRSKPISIYKEEYSISNKKAFIINSVLFIISRARQYLNKNR